MYYEAIAARDPEQQKDAAADTAGLSRFLSAHATG